MTVRLVNPMYLHTEEHMYIDAKTREILSLFGTTVFGYLFEYRMEMACRLLLDSEMNVQEIGNNIGYEHHSHFPTAFKRRFGVSPLEYRMEGINT